MKLNLLSMKITMFSVTLQQLEVLDSVVYSILINVMNYFRWFKIPAEIVFHYKTVLTNISTTIFKWMVMCSNQFVATFIEIKSSFPKNTLLPSHSISLPNMSTLFRTSFASSLAKFPPHHFKWFLTRFTYLGYVFHIPIYYHGLGLKGTC